MLFRVSPDLLGLQVVVELAKQEQGAIEPLLLLGSGVETILEGGEQVLKKNDFIFSRPWLALRFHPIFKTAWIVPHESSYKGASDQGDA